MYMKKIVIGIEKKNWENGTMKESKRWKKEKKILK